MELFGGNTIAPAQLSYTSFEIDTDIVLQWPLNSDPDANFAAQKIDVLATTTNLAVQVPPANDVSTGTDILFRNVGAATFSVNDADGNEIGVVASGEEWYFYITNNETTAGAWASVQFGAGTSTTNAAALAGAGLEAILTTLNQNLPTTAINGDYSPGISDRATVILSTGGVTVLTPAGPTSLGDGWFVYVINAGSGTLTFDGDGATVDGATDKVLNPNESAIFFSDGSNFWTLGYGRSIQSTITAASINLTSEVSPLTLTANQVAAQVQDYSGTLTGGFTVNYGTGVGYWFVRNNTSGAFNLTLRVNGSDAGVIVPQGSYSIVRSNGSNMAIAFTAASGTVSQVNTGTGLTGGPITSTGTISLSNTTVSPGTYGGGLNVPNIAINAQGQITSAANVALGSAAALTAGAAAGNVPVLDANALLPSVNGGASTGDLKFNVGAATITGWVFANGTTIGNAASGATGRANADTVNLFTLLWNTWANAQAPVSGGRGANAAADFAANKTIQLPDLRSRFMGGLNAFGGSGSSGSLTGTIGATGGAYTNTASVSVSGTVTVGGTTSGSLGVSIGGPFADAAGTSSNNFVISSSSLSTTGNLTVSANGGNSMTGSTASFSIVPAYIGLCVYIKL